MPSASKRTLKSRVKSRRRGRDVRSAYFNCVKLILPQANAPQTAQKAEKADSASIDGEKRENIFLRKRDVSDMGRLLSEDLADRRIRDADGIRGGASSPTTIIGDFEKNSMLFLDFSTKNHYNRDK
jgi:hypothetical protein